MKPLATLLLLMFASLSFAQGPERLTVLCCGQDPEAKAKPDGGPQAFQRGLKIPEKDDPARIAKHREATKRHGLRMQMQLQATTAPAKFDCVEMGWVPPIRDQGNCGSCYLVNTADQATCCWIKAGFGKADDSFKISDQFGMDCHDFGGCNGGWPAEVAEFMQKKGFPAERYVDVSGKKMSDYPAYEARVRACRLPANAKIWKIEDWGYVTSDQSDRAATVDEIKSGVMKFGVLNIALGAGGNFDTSDEVCESLPASVDHAITLVGWDDTKGKAGAFKVRNQWSKNWQQAGYRWIGYAAFRNVVEVFWMSTVQLPPPPPPPADEVPVVTSSLFASATVGVRFSYTITASNNPTSFAAAPLPAWLTLSGATLSGTPTAESKVNTTLIATNAAGTGTAQLGITVGLVPVPVNGVTITLSQDLKAGTYQLAGPGSIVMTPEAYEKMKADIIKAVSDAIKQAPKTELKPQSKVQLSLEQWAAWNHAVEPAMRLHPREVQIVAVRRREAVDPIHHASKP